MNHDSAWGRLDDAWCIGSPRVGLQLGAPRACRDAPGRGVAPDGAPMGPLVLVAAGTVDADSLGALASVRSTETPRRHYRIAHVEGEAGQELAPMLARREPRVLVIDAALCDRIGSRALREMHRMNPATRWVVGWNEASPCWVPVLVDTQARGCIEWGCGRQRFVRAIDAVVAGQLWFPRDVSQWLYSALLRVVAGDAVADAPVAAPGVAAELSSRESEVMALMREGLTNKQIGDRLSISVNTVKKHLAHAFEKRGLHTRRQTLA